jgi:hypothetical protein
MDKYPELANEDKQPERIKALTRKSAEAAKKFAGSMSYLMPPTNDPHVREAQALIGVGLKKFFN